MPNKTIYVADADLPIFDQAQELAGENLSATIAQALRRFVANEQARTAGFEEITLKLGDKHTYVNKRFLGRELAKRRTRDADTSKITEQTVFQTAKGRFVLYTRVTPDWNAWSAHWTNGDWDMNWDIDWSTGSSRYHHRERRPDPGQRRERKRFDWSAWSESNEYHMDIFESLDDLFQHIPTEFYSAITQALSGEEDEFLDI